jgi:hypothetical protein
VLRAHDRLARVEEARDGSDDGSEGILAIATEEERQAPFGLGLSCGRPPLDVVLLPGMATPEAQAQEDPAGSCWLTPEEVEELDEADRELEEDEKAGRLRPISELLAKLDQLERS